MMAKMFYTLDETRAALGKTEEDIKQLTREGRLREFRDGPRLMFKADQVEQLKAELGGGTLDQVDLGPSDSGAPIGLADSRGASGSAVGISLSDNEATGTGMSGSGMHMQMKDDTALAGDLGLSGSVGGMPSPSRVGGTMSGTGLTGSMAGGSLGGRGGINVFSADDSVEAADPSAQTAITPQDQVNLEGVGSGSGLLDLTRESDDTSLGAELLDEIAPGTGKGARPGRGRAVSDSGMGAPGESGGRAVTPPTIYVEQADPLAPALGAMAFAASIFVVLGGLVITSATMGTRPALVDMIAGAPGDNRSIWIIFGIGFALAAVFGVVGLVVGKRR
ncbi:MAG: hypothetical protein QOF78_4529 [Phycisphaerales bacterium]|jgi:hypothetical protein|nr:hypothetical protein [Phycisphaerales bacterium]